MKTIKRVDSYSFAKMMSLYNISIGLIFGVIMTIVFLVGLFSLPQYGPSYGVMFALMSLIVFPLIYGIISFIFGLLTVWIYNYISKRFGGIKIEID